MRKLFCSFRALLIELRQGSLSRDDLNAGLFYLDCSRLHAFTPWRHDDGSGRFNELAYLFRKADGTNDHDLAGHTHLRLVSALELAEKEGRIAWRPEEGTRSVQQLNQLLAAHALPPARTPQDPRCFSLGSGRTIRELLIGRDIVVCD